MRFFSFVCNVRIAFTYSYVNNDVFITHYYEKNLLFKVILLLRSSQNLCFFLMTKKNRITHDAI